MNLKELNLIVILNYSDFGLHTHESQLKLVNKFGNLNSIKVFTKHPHRYGVTYQRATMLFHMGIASEEAGKYTICVESEKTARLEN